MAELGQGFMEARDRQRIVRIVVGLLALGLDVAAGFVVVPAARSLGVPNSLLILFGALLVSLQLAAFAVTGISPFRADPQRDPREKRAARRRTTHRWQSGE